MSYPNIETRIQLLLMRLDTYFATASDGSLSVTRGDYSVLDNGDINGHCAVLQQGPFSEDMSGQTGPYNNGTRRWTIVIELYVRYSSADLTPTDMSDFTQAVIDLLDAYPMLDDITGEGQGTANVAVNSGSMPHDIEDENGGGQYFRTRELNITVEEYVKIPVLE